MHHELVDNNGFSFGGFLTTLSALFMNLYNWVSVENINSIVVFCTTVYAAFYMFYKFKNERMMFKKRKRDEENDNESD